MPSTLVTLNVLEEASRHADWDGPTLNAQRRECMQTAAWAYAHIGSAHTSMCNRKRSLR